MLPLLQHTTVRYLVCCSECQAPHLPAFSVSRRSCSRSRSCPTWRTVLVSISTRATRSAHDTAALADTNQHSSGTHTCAPQPAAGGSLTALQAEGAAIDTQLQDICPRMQVISFWLAVHAPSSMAATHSLTLLTKLPAKCSMSARRCSRSSLQHSSSSSKA